MAQPLGGAPGAPSAGVLSAALAAFPPVAHAFAYGSGIFAQPGAAAVRAGEQPMLDFIFAARSFSRRCTRAQAADARALAQVDDPVAWHAANLARNRRHYSLLGAAGPSAVAAVAERVGAGVHFNAFARVDPLGPARVKYGVVALPTLLRDLRDWDALYVAGRMHKPVATLRADSRVAAAAEGNLAAALACALLLLPVRPRVTTTARHHAGVLTLRRVWRAGALQRAAAARHAVWPQLHRRRAHGHRGGCFKSTCACCVTGGPGALTACSTPTRRLSE